jgi:hypothetical protein
VISFLDGSLAFFEDNSDSHVHLLEFLKRGSLNSPYSIPYSYNYSMSPYCRRCGRELPDESRFCPECGHEQDVAASQQEIGDTLREAARRLADRAINVSGQHKDLLCERCNKMTEHISVSWAELADEAPISDSSTFVKNSLRALGRVGDLEPISNIHRGRPYRCTSCHIIRFD